MDVLPHVPLSRDIMRALIQEPQASISVGNQGLKRRKNLEEATMSKKAAEHHHKAAEHHTHAARHHGEAAKHHEAGHHEKAAHHAHTARSHAIHSRHHAEEASKMHGEEHGKK
jgi:hypothetical protein